MGFFSFGGIFINKHLDMLPNDNIRHYTKRDIPGYIQRIFIFCRQTDSIKAIGYY